MHKFSEQEVVSRGKGAASTVVGSTKGGRKGGPRGGGRKAGTRATATVRSGNEVGGLQGSSGSVEANEQRNSDSEANIPRNTASEANIPRDTASEANILIRDTAGVANVPSATATAEDCSGATRGGTTRGRRGATRNKAGNLGPTLRSQTQPTNNRRTVRGIKQNTPPEELYDSFYDDPGYDEKLQARNGCLGTLSSHGFEAKTNFLIDVHGLINSSSVYKLKGTNIFLNN